MSKMHSNSRGESLQFWTLIALCAAIYGPACSSSSSDDTGAGGQGALTGGVGTNVTGAGAGTGGKSAATGGKKATGGTSSKAATTAALTCTTAMEGTQGCSCLLSTPTCLNGLVCDNVVKKCCDAGDCNIPTSSGTGGKASIGGGTSTSVGGVAAGGSGAGGTPADAGTSHDAGQESDASAGDTSVGGGTSGAGHTSSGGNTNASTANIGGILSTGGTHSVGGVTSAGGATATGGADSGIEDAGTSIPYCVGSPGPTLPTGQNCTGSESCHYLYGTGITFNLFTCTCSQGLVGCMPG